MMAVSQNSNISVGAFFSSSSGGLETPAGVSLVMQSQPERVKQEEITETEKLNKKKFSFEKLHIKYGQNRPWPETMKVVRQAMEKRPVLSPGDHQHLVNCLESLQKALQVGSLSSMTDRLESIARQNNLSSHLSPSGTVCYITSDMFYLEVVLDPSGEVCDVKVAHLGENLVSCPELVQHLREKDFEAFSKHLKGIVSLYRLPGDNKLKTKMYLPLQSLELDLNKMSAMYGQATNASTLDTILYGSVGLLTARSGVKHQLHMHVDYLLKGKEAFCFVCCCFINYFFFPASSGLLQFEVCPLTDTCFSVSFQHPVNESLVCAVMDVMGARHVNCKLYKGLSDALICIDDFIARVVQRCMSIPVTMRAIRRKAETIQADTPALPLIAETVEDLVKKNLPPASSPGYGMGTGSNPLSGATTPTSSFCGSINSLFNLSICPKEKHDSIGHSEDINKVTQNPILSSLLHGNVGPSIGSSPTPPRHTPPPVSSPASNTKNHPMLLNLLKDNPPQDISTLYGSSPLEKQNSSSGSPRMDISGGAVKQKKKRLRQPSDKPKHQTEDDFQKELFSMDVDSQNTIFDVNMSGDSLDNPHITPTANQCSTSPTVYQQPIAHIQSSLPRIARLSSSDSISAEVTEILSDIAEEAEEASKLPISSDDCPPMGSPSRDSSRSAHLFEADVFQSGNDDSTYTDPADLIADVAGSPASDSSNPFFPGVDFNPDLLETRSEFEDMYFDTSHSGEDEDDDDDDELKEFPSQALGSLGIPIMGGDGGDSRIKGADQTETVDFSIITGSLNKPVLSSEIMDHHSGNHSPLLSTGDLSKDKSQKLRKDGNGTGGSSMSGMGLEGKPAKRSRTPSNDGKSKDKPPKRKKNDAEVKSPSHSSSGRPFTPPSSTGGSKSPGSLGASQTPPGGATPPIPKITIQIPKGTVSVGKPSSLSQYTSSSSMSSGSKSHHSHSSSSSSSGKIKSKSEGSSSSKLSSSLYSGQSNTSSGQLKGSSQSVGKSGSSPVAKHGLSSSSGSSGSKIKPQGKPSSLMNPSVSKQNISPSHSRPSSGSEKLASPMKSVPGTPPSSKAKSPISSGSGSSHISGTSSGSSLKSSSGIVSSGPCQKNSLSGSSSNSSFSSSSSSSSQNPHGSSKGKSPSRNKKPSLTAVIDKLKHGVGSGPGGDDIGDGTSGVGPTPSSHGMPSKHSMSSVEFPGKRDKSEKDKSKPVSTGSSESSKKTSDSKNVGSTGVAKIIISKQDGGSPTIKTKVTLQKPGDGSGDGLRPQMPASKSYGSPLISGSTPKHERCSPSHSKSPAYTPQNIDSGSESGSSIAERSYQNSPSSDDDIRPLPEYSLSEKHKKHKKEKKKAKDKDRDRDKDRDKEREKKKSHSIKPESWSKSPISSETSLAMAAGAMLSSERPSRPSPGFLMKDDDDDLMDVALIGS
ncbi:mediator of RNA polymerase II transcription subunit 1 [Protopterus annectens]|uniref:mediator of RNA polymerase II transcription subunit 1 n=1 Tax=Protopterus annectens TaxID=7888 RepID=UPI001CFB8FA7|nr:mediator of RNA polymerase II transcription subunit 1 [Protopterus annectens]